MVSDQRGRSGGNVPVESDDGARSSKISTALTELLGIDHPIVLAPMGDVAGGRLAAAVSAAGGFGQIGGGYCELDYLNREIDLAEGARVGVGFITFSLDQEPSALDIALELGPPAIQCPSVIPDHT